jgi:DNA-binding NarL/FixJ family response regulator
MTAAPDSAHAVRTIPIVLMDPEPLPREALRALLERNTDLRVVAEAGDGDALVRAVERFNPRVALIDAGADPEGAATAVARIGRRRPAIRVLAFTRLDDERLLFRLIRAGACGLMLKDARADWLAGAIRSADRGGAPLCPFLAQRILRWLRDGDLSAVCGDPADSRGDALTAREADVLSLLGQGALNGEIAGRLALSEGTVRNYICSILAKIGVHDRTQAALYAVRHGLTTAQQS